MTEPITDPKPGDRVLLGRRAVVRGGFAGGLALAGVLVEAAFRGVDAKPKPAKKPTRRAKATTVKTAGVKAAETSTGTNGADKGGDTAGPNTPGTDNTGLPATGNDGTGTNAPSGNPTSGQSQTGESKGGDTTGTSDTKPPVQGGTNTGSTVHCTTRGAIVDAQNPANNRPAETVCTTT
jgi:hypothetical protein